MALTATAKADTRKQVILQLCMKDPSNVYVPPAKSNIYYTVQEKPAMALIVQKIADDLLKHKNKADRVLMYCRKLLDVAPCYELLLNAQTSSIQAHKYVYMMQAPNV